MGVDSSISGIPPEGGRIWRRGMKFDGKVVDTRERVRLSHDCEVLPSWHLIVGSLPNRMRPRLA